MAEEDALHLGAPQPPRMRLQVGVLTLLPKADAQEPRLVADVPVEEAEDRPSHPLMPRRLKRESRTPRKTLRQPIACPPAFPRL